MEEEEFHVKEVSFSFRSHYSLSSPAVLEKNIQGKKDEMGHHPNSPLLQKGHYRDQDLPPREGEREGGAML